MSLGQLQLQHRVGACIGTDRMATQLSFTARIWCNARACGHAISLENLLTLSSAAHRTD